MIQSSVTSMSHDSQGCLDYQTDRHSTEQQIPHIQSDSQTTRLLQLFWLAGPFVRCDSRRTFQLTRGRRGVAEVLSARIAAVCLDSSDSDLLVLWSHGERTRVRKSVHNIRQQEGQEESRGSGRTLPARLKSNICKLSRQSLGVLIFRAESMSGGVTKSQDCRSRAAYPNHKGALLWNWPFHVWWTDLEGLVYMPAQIVSEREAFRIWPDTSNARDSTT